jgi:hypothetical protein
MGLGAYASFCLISDAMADDFWLVSGKRSGTLAVCQVVVACTECKC